MLLLEETDRLCRSLLQHVMIIVNYTRHVSLHHVWDTLTLKIMSNTSLNIDDKLRIHVYMISEINLPRSGCTQSLANKSCTHLEADRIEYQLTIPPKMPHPSSINSLRLQTHYQQNNVADERFYIQTFPVFVTFKPVFF